MPDWPLRSLKKRRSLLRCVDRKQTAVRMAQEPARSEETVRYVRSTKGITSYSRKSRNAAAPPEVAPLDVLVGVNHELAAHIWTQAMAHVHHNHRRRIRFE